LIHFYKRIILEENIGNKKQTAVIFISSDIRDRV